MEDWLFSVAAWEWLHHYVHRPQAKTSPVEPLLLLFRLSVVFDSFATPWTVAHQAPLSMGFPRQEHWSGLLFPPPGNILNPGTELASSALAGRFFTTWEAPRRSAWSEKGAESVECLMNWGHNAWKVRKTLTEAGSLGDRDVACLPSVLAQYVSSLGLHFTLPFCSSLQAPEYSPWLLGVSGLDLGPKKKENQRPPQSAFWSPRFPT